MTIASGHPERAVWAPGKKQVRGVDSYDVLAFIIPFLEFIQLHMIGTMSGSDILLIVVFLYLGFRGKIKLKAPRAKWIIASGLLWLVSQVVTDVVRHSAFADYARGWSNIGLTLVNFAVFFSILYQKPRRMAIYGWGLVIGSLLSFWISPSKNMQDDPWKFGFAVPVCWAVFLIASHKNCRGHWPAILATAVGIINIVMGSRSNGGFCLAAAFYLFTSHFLRKRAARGVKLKVGAIAAIAATLVIGAIGMVWAYSYAAKAGMLGEQARDKYKLDSGGKYGILLGGRVEVFASIPAIYASPILGHGSWARDRIYVFLEKRALALMGYNVREEMDPDAFKEGYIPTHSYILGAWVNAGILGAIFWSGVFVLVARALMRVYPSGVPMLPFAAFAGFETLWDCLVFSVRGGNANHHSVLHRSSHNLHEHGIARSNRCDQSRGAETAERFQGCCIA